MLARVVVHNSVGHPVVQWVHLEADRQVLPAVLSGQEAGKAAMASQEAEVHQDQASQEAVHQDHQAVEASLVHQAVAREAAATTDDGWPHLLGHQTMV